MLPLGLTTNEVKDAAGLEVEMQRWKVDGRSVEFQKVGELPNAENRIKVSHQDLGSGVDARRRSAVIGRLQVAGVSGAKREWKVTITIDAPVGDVASYTDGTKLMAEVGSFTYTLGGTTFLYDGTGTGSAAILAGSL
jgi:hypothetical protein